jgi:hypothetical protein
MKKHCIIYFIAALAAFIPATHLFAEGGSSIGLGASYYTAIDDLDSDFDDSGFSYFVSYQYQTGLIGLEVNAELLPEIFDERGFAPSAYVLLGETIYVAAGIGIINYDGEWTDDPFYAFKAGIKLQLSGNLAVDVFANYQFSSEIAVGDAVDDIDTDTVFLGAAVRF